MIIYITDKICPLKNFSIKKLSDPWITAEILEIIFEKDRLLNKAKHIKNDNDWILAKNARNETNITIRNSKADFVKENLELHKNNSKLFWKNTNSILPQKNNKKNNFINLTDDNDILIVSNTQSSNYINNFFTSIGPKLATKKRDDNLWTYHGIYSNNEVNDFVTNEEEIRKLCQDINTTKSSAIPLTNLAREY